jgi:hypothetical protein
MKIHQHIVAGFYRAGNSSACQKISPAAPATLFSHSADSRVFASNKLMFNQTQCL